jgi:tRNA pseudouridine55 synthase
VDGFIIVNKAQGRSSFSVVKTIKNITRAKKIGHTGTLDPLADGVLPICLGEATKLSPFVMNGKKKYFVKIKLGESTDTFDATGKVTAKGERSPSDVNAEEIRQILSQLNGDIMQIPPMYSALKHKGTPLYEIARSGREVERKARKVTINNVEFVEFSDPFIAFTLECTKGTYVRSIADELGRALNTLGHVVNLTRLRVGSFSIEDSIKIDESTPFDFIKDNLIDTETACSRFLKVVEVDLVLARKIAHGYQMTLSELKSHLNLLKDYPEDGQLAFFAKDLNGRNKLVAVTKVLIEDYMDLMSMGPAQKILEIQRVFNFDCWK